MLDEPELDSQSECCLPSISHINIKEESCETPLIEDQNKSVELCNNLNERLSNIRKKLKISVYDKSCKKDFQNHELHLFESNALITNEIISNITGMRAEFFFVLYDFLENYMTVLFNKSKMEQLLCVLGKLHLNKMYFVNEFQFPLVFASNIDIFFDIFQIINISYPLFPLSFPKFVDNSFSLPQRVRIIDVLTIKIKGDCSQNYKINYLLAYTLDGRIIFNSKALPDISVKAMINQSNIIKYLRKDAQLLICHKSAQSTTCLLEDGIYLVNYSNNSNLLSIIRKCGSEIENYAKETTCKLQIVFPILNEILPFYMIKDNNTVCFLDKLVSVCCKLYNIMYLNDIKV
ncbi:uncharacterized protein LOC108736957 [Agrilus planipennis]|uniref:Uncharacterized protein LOC108736957 n=1 Tax=Agrilus planipennis TaxID=224129 RepID=A0A1W4WMC1_AGRPL|nr:uncharacterized protein LOC108736957 [Agrilus planipennis]